MINPTAPALTAPANGAIVTTTTVTLRWQQPADWGYDCYSNDPKTFLVYIGTNPSTQTLLTTVPSTTTSVSFGAVSGFTYYWKVVAQNNQPYNNAESAIWSFTVAPVTIKARAVLVPPGTPTCVAAAASTTGIAGSSFKFAAGSASNPAAKTQVGATFVQFTGLVPGSYTLASTIPPTYIKKLSCWSKTGAAPWTSGPTVSTTGGNTVTWNMGYVPPVTIKVRAVRVSPADTSCAAAVASTDGINGAVLQFTPGSASNPAAQTQSGAAYKQFTNLLDGTYTLSSVVPASFTLKRSCWTKTAGAPWSGGLAAVTLGGDTVTWDLAYTDVIGIPWTQASGGDVYAVDMLSTVPSLAAPRVFDADGTGGYPGLVTYGESFNFDPSDVDNGKAWTSSKKWLAHDTFPLVDYYALFYRRFGGAPTTVDYINPTTPITQPTSRSAPYYVTGDMTTSGDWTVGDGENLIFFVDGDLTINGKINITGTGFVSFIVNGNISVDPSVGVLYTSGTPVVEGVYVTSSKGVFQTGASTSVSHERFVGRGMFVAGSFALERDLDPTDTTGNNDATAAELFIYNPRLLITMPDKMRESPVSWQEVAP